MSVSLLAFTCYLARQAPDSMALAVRVEGSATQRPCSFQLKQFPVQKVNMKNDRFS